jgi:hypothetical protein
VIRNLVDCLKFLTPMVVRGDVSLLYDYQIEGRGLIQGEAVTASLNHLPNGDDGPDIRRIWFMMRSRAQEVPEDSRRNAIVSHANGSECVDGEISAAMLAPDIYWLSFGGCPLVEAERLTLSYDAEQGTEAINAHDLASVSFFYPRYEHNDKHRQIAYRDARGEDVAPMRIKPEDAYKLMLISVADGNRRWAYHEGLRSFVHFKANAEGTVLHGFEDNDGVPFEVRDRLRPLR